MSETDSELRARNNGKFATMPLAVRLWSKVDKSGKCWIWTGYTSPKGYGTMKVNGVTTSVHRVSYLLAKGAIPKGLVIDHLCCNPPCINPDHLEAVTNRENTKRGFKNNPITHCNRGHELIEGNIYVSTNPYSGVKQRACKICAAETSRLRYQKKQLKQKLLAAKITLTNEQKPGGDLIEAVPISVIEEVF